MDRILARQIAHQSVRQKKLTAAAAETERPNPEEGGAIVGSSNSRVYHYYNCVFAKKIAPENLVTFKSVDEAKAQGRRPCRVCRPP